jgi:fibronectin-binding autotransporter adhesin
MIAAVFSHNLRRGRATTWALALCSALAAGPALGQSGSWNVDADGTWSVNSNWLGNTIAGGVGNTATFANNISGTKTVTLDTNRSIGRFVFGDADTASAGSWVVSGSTMTMNSGVNSGTITVNALGTGATATISSVLGASGTTPSIIKDGVGTLVLGGTNGFTSTLAIQQGTLQVGADRNLGGTGSFATNRITISDGAILKTSTNFTLNANRGITVGSGTGTLNINGGTLALAAPVAGPGTMLVTGPNALNLTSTTASSVNWDLSSNNSVRTFFEGVNALGTGSVRVRGGVRLTQTATTSGSGSITNAITLDSGAGLTARVANTYSSVIFPSSGTVQFNVDEQTTSTLTITSSGTLAGDLVVSTQQGGANAVGNVFLNGVFSGAGGLVKTGTGASGLLILRGANTYTGTTAINTGTLQLGNGGTVGTLSTSSVITGSAGATLAFNRSDKIASGTDFNSVIGGAIGVSQVGSGTVVLSSSSTYTGATSITNGTLEISNNGSLGPAPGSFTADHLQISGGATLRTTAAVNLGANRGVTVGTGTATLNINGSGNLQVGRFTGAGNTVAVTGSSSLTLLAVTTGTADVNWDFAMNSGQRVFFNGSNALGTGTVRVGSGIRLVSQNTALTGGQVTNAVTLENGAGLSARSTAGAVEYTNVILPSSGSIVLNKDDLATSGLTIQSGVSLTGVLTVDTSQGGSNAVGDVTLSGVFTGVGGLVKAGTGTSGRLILGGASTYTGNTTISTGTLQLGPAGSIASSGTINVASGASFDVSAVSGGFSLGAAQALVGVGTVLGNVTALGTIAPGSSPGTLTFTNDLSLGSGSILNYELNGADQTVGGGVNDLSSIAGDLTLAGTINVAEIGSNSFLSATVGNAWRLFNYSGSLTNNTLSLGSMPALSSGLSFSVDTATAGQVNLVIVPEPGTIVTVMVGLGMLGVVGARRRLRRIGR